MRRDHRRPNAARLAICALIYALLVSCVSISPNPTTSLHPTVSPPPTADQTSSPTPASSLQPTSTATSAQTPVDTHEGATPPPETPAATIDPALAAEIDSVVAQVPPIRELDALTTVPYEFISREQFRQDLIALNDQEVTPEQRATEERFLKRMGLLPADADLNALLLELYGGSVAAFYRPDTGRFYIIQSDQPFGPADEMVVAHEYTHALQDQHFNLEGTRVADPSEGDAALGQLAVIEGDATLTMQLWAIENLSPAELLEVLAQSIQQLDDQTLVNMPLLLRRQLEFPYAEGFAFAQQLHDLGGYDAVNAALSTAVPASTEQVLHPEKYLANEARVDVTISDASPVLNDGSDMWSLSYSQTVGELDMQVWAAGGESPPDVIPGQAVDWPHAETVAGWGGDRVNMYEGPDRAWIIDWHTAWDTASDAEEFAARATEVQGLFGGPSHVFSAQQNVRVVVASEEGLINLLP